MREFNVGDWVVLSDYGMQEFPYNEVWAPHEERGRVMEVYDPDEDEEGEIEYLSYWVEWENGASNEFDEEYLERAPVPVNFELEDYL